jgi:hypothetical protein
VGRNQNIKFLRSVGTFGDCANAPMQFPSPQGFLIGDPEEAQAQIYSVLKLFTGFAIAALMD